jgi:hypothetical protein
MLSLKLHLCIGQNISFAFSSKAKESGRAMHIESKKNACQPSKALVFGLLSFIQQ